MRHVCNSGRGCGWRRKSCALVAHEVVIEGHVGDNQDTKPVGRGGRIGECMEDVYMGVAMRTDTCMSTHTNTYTYTHTYVQGFI